MAGRAGAYATSILFIDRRTGLVIVLLVQHAGFNAEVGKMSEEFWRAAVERHGADANAAK